MDEVIAAYFEAWNEADPRRRQLLLEEAVTDDAELIEPTGVWRGVCGLSERIGNYIDAAPGARVVPTSGVDAHNHVVRYSWSVVTADGVAAIEGLDVAERAGDARLARIFMFHGLSPPTASSG